jgi:hypothetical protein
MLHPAKVGVEIVTGPQAVSSKGYLESVIDFDGVNTEIFGRGSQDIPPITYYWTVPLILDHSYLVGKSTSSKIADTKVSGF